MEQQQYVTYVADGEIVDGSWELNILVTDLQVEKTLRVMGDLHIGGVMVKLVQALERTPNTLNKEQAHALKINPLAPCYKRDGVNEVKWLEGSISHLKERKKKKATT
ncbi:fermitin family [Plakobranchus ocellatus]|uniref:Fermitin family n=1 Tax=Plakobranchus ocellatus TaxID=259542 RepID=A0AAV4ABK5_9GAST|nr:fermitin family [Plakobranchus ocellatus]